MKSLLSVLALLFSASSFAQINFCNPRDPVSCQGPMLSENGLRPSATYTFSNELKFKKCDETAYADCFKNDSLLRQPFILGTKAQLEGDAKAPVAVLMIHGLSDGPYYNKPMGTMLFEKFGIPVVAIRLSGHGTQAGDLGLKDQHQWYKDVDEGYQIAKRLGHRVIVTGFSLGGVLAVDLYKKRSSENAIGGLLLFSPALGLPTGVAQLTCLAADLNKKSVFTAQEDFKGGGHLIRYMRMAYAGACNIQNITHEVNAFGTVDQIRVPVFTLLSTDDKAVHRKGIYEFMSKIEVAKLFVINKTPGPLDAKELAWKYVLAPQKPELVEYHEAAAPLDHSWVMLDPNNSRDRGLSQQLNPLFTEESKSVCRFVTANIPELAGNTCN